MKYLSDDQESKRKLIPSDRVKEDNKEDSENFIKYLNTKNTKIFATVLVVLFVIYHGYLNSHYGKATKLFINQ